jgi:hypothetical protein
LSNWISDSTFRRAWDHAVGPRRVAKRQLATWARRRQAARLLAAVTNPDRGFEAVIVGESERAFTGTQLLHLAQVFLAHGVQVWLPEVDGPVDLADPAHQVLIMRLGERGGRTPARPRQDVAPEEGPKSKPSKVTTTWCRAS